MTIEEVGDEEAGDEAGVLEGTAELEGVGVGVGLGVGVTRIVEVEVTGGGGAQL